MNRKALRLLKTTAKHGEISLLDAIQLSKRSNGSHLDQYPLALLLEDGYLGITMNYTPPTGAEKMREFSLATTLHMFTLPKDKHGEVNYIGIVSSGCVNPADERVFLKAKGALYLDERTQKFWDRFWSFVLGFATGLLASIGAAYLKGRLGLV